MLSLAQMLDELGLYLLDFICIQIVVNEFGLLAGIVAEIETQGGRSTLREVIAMVSCNGRVETIAFAE